MCFIEEKGKNYYRANRPFMWKLVGGADYINNGFDESISDIFNRLIAEMNYSKANNETTEHINIFAYAANLGTNWKGIEIIKTMKEIDILFSPTKDALDFWKKLSSSDENHIKRRMDNNIPVCSCNKKLWNNNKTWKNINPPIEYLVDNQSIIPDSWWIFRDKQDEKYNGFVVKDIEYYRYNYNNYINFEKYTPYFQEDSFGSSTNSCLLKRRKDDKEYAIPNRSHVPVVAKAKLISPYIVSINK